MNILLIDAQGILSQKQAVYAKNRLRYSLARFDHRVNGVTMHFSLDDDCEAVRCKINVNVEEGGIVSVLRRNVSSQEALNLSVDAIEPKVACRVDWKMWFNADTFATWMLSASAPLKSVFGFKRPVARWPANRGGASRRHRLGGSRSGSLST